MLAQDQAFKAMVENSSDVIAVVDRAGRIVYESPTVSQVLGYKPEEMLGRDITDFIHPEDLDRVSRTYGFLAQAPGSSVETEVRFRHKNGTWLQLEGRGRNLLDTPGINGILVNYRDVTAIRRQQQDLADMVAEYRFVADNIADVIWRADSTLRLNYISRAVTKQLGYSVEEALSMKVSELFTPDAYDVVVRAANELLDQPDTEWAVFELKHPHKDGAIIWTETTCRIVRDKEGRPKAILGVARDITDRKKAEDLLQRHHEALEEEVTARTAELVSANNQLRKEIEERIEAEKALQAAKEFAENLIETANAMVVGTDNTGNIIIFNQAAENITGYTREEVLGRNYFDLIVPRDRYPYVWEKFKNSHAGIIPRRMENPIVNKSGQERHVMWQNSSLHAQGKVVGILAFGIDITERKRAETRLERAFKREKHLHEHMEELVKERTRKLLETEQRFRQVADNTPDIIASFDLEQRHVAVNKTVIEMMGLKEEEIIGKTFQDLGTPEEVTRQWTSLQMHVIESGQSITAETSMSTPQGPRFFELLVNPIRDESGTVTGTTAIARDVTERRRAEEDLRQLSRRIVQLQEEERTSLARDLHDEIGQTLTFLSLQLERIRRASPEEMRGNIVEAKNALAETIRNVRDLSHALHPSQLEIGLAQAVTDLRNRFVTESEIDLKLEHAIPGLVPPQVALALYRIVQEALTNIVRHSGADRAKIQMRESDNIIELIVEDNGVGFDPKTVGRSIGLTGISERARSLGGEYHLDTRPGAGTRITVRLPMTGHQA